MEQSPLQSAPLGAIRFNTDSSKLEYYDGNQWVNITSTSPEAQTGGTRGLFGGGLTPSNSAVIDYINIDTTGNATNFGTTLGEARQAMGACASRTRALQLGGYTTNFEDRIDYITIGDGETAEFGDLSVARNRGSGVSNQIRGILGGGNIPGASSDTIDYVTIASIGDAKDFGNLTAGRQSLESFASITRGVFTGGYIEPTYVNTIDYITISTLGNAADFGDQTVARFYGGSFSNSTRGITGGGQGAPSGNQLTTIDYNTIASLGNAVDFGDMTSARRDVAGASSPTRGVFCGGDTPTLVNTIDYVQIMTTGNAVDFGDQTTKRDRVAGTSNGHGGLG